MGADPSGWASVLDINGQPVTVVSNGNNIVLSNYFAGRPEAWYPRTSGTSPLFQQPFRRTLFYLVMRPTRRWT
jgi:hypothetical protein